MKCNRTLTAAVVVLVGAAMLMVAQPALGELIAYDGFSGYEVDTNLVGQALPEGSGFGTETVTKWTSYNFGGGGSSIIKSGPLTYTNAGAELVVSGDQRVDQVLVNGYVKEHLTTPISTGTVYMSVLARAPSTASGTGTWGPYVTVNWENITAFVPLPHDDTVHLAVIRLDLGTEPNATDDTFTTWIDPVPGTTEESNIGQMLKDDEQLKGGGGSKAWDGTLTAFLARGGWDISFDEIRFGETWEDVTPSLVTVLLGDADDNGVVDAADYIALKANIGQATGATTADGDFDGDGDVDWTDLQTLQEHFGETSDGSMVPEPASAMLLMFGAAALLRRRLRK